jgi:hypothetical protein
VTNAAEIFNDFDSYGVLPEQTVRTADVIPKMIGERVVPQGPEPKLAYFAGRRVLVDKAVEGAQIRVEHWPADGTKVPVGVALESKIMIGIIFSSPLHLEECLNAVMRLAQFLSLLAGRPQGVTDVQIYEKVDETLGDRPWLLHWSFAPEPEDSGEPDPPSFFDMPLDPIRRAGEFEQVLAGWWASHADAGLARARLHACRRKGNRFDTDRLVAAANMFDLRPVAVGDDVPPALAQARDLSVAAFKKLPRSDDRDSAIQALKRLGSPSLRKKVIARAKLVAVHFHLDRLDEVLRIAVWARNRFVHGAGDTTFDYEAVDPHTTFLTETLEFIFAAAELIECGWRAANWRSQPHSSSHWFARYLSGYAADMESLLAACERA